MAIKVFSLQTWSAMAVSLVVQNEEDFQFLISLSPFLTFIQVEQQAFLVITSAKWQMQTYTTSKMNN